MSINSVTEESTKMTMILNALYNQPYETKQFYSDFLNKLKQDESNLETRNFTDIQRSLISKYNITDAADISTKKSMMSKMLFEIIQMQNPRKQYMEYYANTLADYINSTPIQSSMNIRPQQNNIAPIIAKSQQTVNPNIVDDRQAQIERDRQAQIKKEKEIENIERRQSALKKMSVDEAVSQICRVDNNIKQEYVNFFERVLNNTSSRFNPSAESSNFGKGTNPTILMSIIDLFSGTTGNDRKKYYNNIIRKINDCIEQDKPKIQPTPPQSNIVTEICSNNDQTKILQYLQYINTKNGGNDLDVRIKNAIDTTQQPKSNLIQQIINTCINEPTIDYNKLCDEINFRNNYIIFIITLRNNEIYYADKYNDYQHDIIRLKLKNKSKFTNLLKTLIKCYIDKQHNFKKLDLLKSVHGLDPDDNTDDDILRNYGEDNNELQQYIKNALNTPNFNITINCNNTPYSVLDFVKSFQTKSDKDILTNKTINPDVSDDTFKNLQIFALKGQIQQVINFIEKTCKPVVTQPVVTQPVVTPPPPVVEDLGDSICNTPNMEKFGYIRYIDNDNSDKEKINYIKTQYGLYSNLCNRINTEANTPDQANTLRNKIKMCIRKEVIHTNDFNGTELLKYIIFINYLISLNNDNTNIIFNNLQGLTEEDLIVKKLVINKIKNPDSLKGTLQDVVVMYICQNENNNILTLYEYLIDNTKCPEVFNEIRIIIDKDKEYYKKKVIECIVVVKNYSEISSEICNQFSDYDKVNSYINFIKVLNNNNKKRGNDDLQKNIKILFLKQTNEFIVLLNNIYNCLKDKIINFICKTPNNVKLYINYLEKSNTNGTDERIINFIKLLSNTGGFNLKVEDITQCIPRTPKQQPQKYTKPTEYKSVLKLEPIIEKKSESNDKEGEGEGEGEEDEEGKGKEGEGKGKEGEGEEAEEESILIAEPKTPMLINSSDSITIITEQKLVYIYDKSKNKVFEYATTIDNKPNMREVQLSASEKSIQILDKDGTTFNEITKNNYKEYYYPKDAEEEGIDNDVDFGEMQKASVAVLKIFKEMQDKTTTGP